MSKDFSKRVKIYNKAIYKWGLPLQILKMCEECGELIQAACKVGFNKWPVSKLAEEIADVEIMTEQLKIAYNIESAVEEAKQEKLKRLENRLKDG